MSERIERRHLIWLVAFAVILIAVGSGMERARASTTAVEPAPTGPSPSGPLAPSPTGSFQPTPSARPTFVPLTVEIVVPQSGHPITLGTPLNTLVRLSSQYGYDREGFSVHATLRQTILAVERIREFETGPETLGVKLLVPSPDGPTDLYPGDATLRICVNTSSSALGVGAFGCGTLQVVIR